MIKLRNVSFSYESQYVLDNVNLSFREGEIVVVLGLNGSGKTSLFKMMNALLLPTLGSVTVDGMNTMEKEKVWKIRRKVGMIFQNPENQIVGTTVEEDVAFGMENIGISREEMSKRIEEVLNFVGLKDMKNVEPFHLSGGQKQLLCVASVLAMKPKYIVMDEPTSMVDPPGRKRILKTMKEMNHTGKTVIFSTHILDEIVIANRVVYLRKGRVIYDGNPMDVLNEVKEEFGTSKFLEVQHKLHENGYLDNFVDFEELKERLKEFAN